MTVYAAPWPNFAGFHENFARDRPPAWMVQRATRGSGNLNDQMMEKVSNAGNGMYALISSTDEADNYAQNRLLSTLVHVAKDMKIQVEFNPAQVAAYRLLGYEDRAIADMSFPQRRRRRRRGRRRSPRSTSWWRLDSRWR